MYVLEYMENGQAFYLRYNDTSAVVRALQSLYRTGITRVKVTNLNNTVTTKCCAGR